MFTILLFHVFVCSQVAIFVTVLCYWFAISTLILFAHLHSSLRIDHSALTLALTLRVPARIYLLSFSHPPHSVSDNYSQVDRIWSIVPGYYAMHFCFMPALAAHVKCALEGNLSCSVGINIVPLIMTVLIWYG